MKRLRLLFPLLLIVGCGHPTQRFVPSDAGALDTKTGKTCHPYPKDKAHGYSSDSGDTIPYCYDLYKQWRD